ncbi:MAG: DUF3828 domain-containing protein [Bacteroidaceae bacterium]|nr:DUF3828 domain-containing protein [Bacteroidaceae bacterium]
MKKTLFLLSSAVMVLSGCNGNKVSNPANVIPEDSVFMLDGPGSIYDGTKEKLGEEAYQKVEQLYEAVHEAYSGDDWMNKSGKLDEKFCSKEWNATLEAVREKDSKNPDDIGFFDFDYWVMGQDFDAENLHASEIQLIRIDTEDEPHEATVKLTLHNFSDTEVRVYLVYEDGEWKVDDLNGIKEDMQKYLKQ